MISLEESMSRHLPMMHFVVISVAIDHYSRTLKKDAVVIEKVDTPGCSVLSVVYACA